LRPFYRASQFFAELRHRNPVEQAEWMLHLNDAQATLLESLPSSEQRHAVTVLCMLQQNGHREAALMQAALLHDAGKVLPAVRQGSHGAQLRVWHRVAVVLIRALYPALLRRVAQDRPGSWRYPFYVLLHHAALGAGLAIEAGSDPLAAELIYWHHTAPDESLLDARGREMLSALQAADDKV